MASESPILTGLAGRYATALYELADESKALDQVAADLAKLKAAIAENADLQRLIASPLVPRDQLAKAVLAVVGKMGLSDLTRRFVGIVARNRRLEGGDHSLFADLVKQAGMGSLPTPESMPGVAPTKTVELLPASRRDSSLLSASGRR